MIGRETLLDVFWSLSEGESSLNPFQRVLLMTDGTVTDVVEVYTGETIRVVKLAQSFGGDSSETTPRLGTDGPGRLLHRTVLLQGSKSGTNFIHAESVIAPDWLPPTVLEGLLETGRPIGKLLSSGRIETFREIVGLGFEPAGDCAEHFGVDPASNLVFRTYRIHVSERPVMRITEKFPTSWFAHGVDF